MTDRPIKNKYIMISEKLSKAAKSVIPIVAVVLVLSLTIAPIPTDLMLSFLLGTLFLVLGMCLFSLGAEAGAVLFSLPVTSVEGFGLFDD